MSDDNILTKWPFLGPNLPPRGCAKCLAHLAASDRHARCYECLCAQHARSGANSSNCAACVALPQDESDVHLQHFLTENPMDEVLVPANAVESDMDSDESPVPASVVTLHRPHSPPPHLPSAWNTWMTWVKPWVCLFGGGHCCELSSSRPLSGWSGRSANSVSPPGSPSSAPSSRLSTGTLIVPGRTPSQPRHWSQPSCHSRRKRGCQNNRQGASHI